MIKLIAILTMIFTPVISVSTGSNDKEPVLQSRDLCDRHCSATPSGGGDGGGGSSAFSGGGVFEGKTPVDRND